MILDAVDTHGGVHPSQAHREGASQSYEQTVSTWLHSSLSFPLSLASSSGSPLLTILASLLAWYLVL